MHTEPRWPTGLQWMINSRGPVMLAVRRSVTIACQNEFAHPMKQSAKPTRWIFAAGLIGIQFFSLTACASDGTKLVSVFVTWEGIAVKRDLKAVPNWGVIAHQKQWERSWNILYPNQTAPSVNFRDAIILAVPNTDPNGFEMVPYVERNGNLKIRFTSEMRGFANPVQAFAYKFQLIRRNGIKTFYGRPIDGGEPSDAPESASRDASTMEDQLRGPGDR